MTDEERHEIEITAVTHVTENYPEITLRNAVHLFQKVYKDANILNIAIDGDDKLVVGWCEVCNMPLFEDSDYVSDSEGVMWCRKHDKED